MDSDSESKTYVPSFKQEEKSVTVAAINVKRERDTFDELNHVIDQSAFCVKEEIDIMCHKVESDVQPNDQVRQKVKTLPKEMESKVRKYSVLEQLKFLLLDNSESNVSQLCQKGKYVFKNDEVLQSEQKKQELATSVEYPQAEQPSPENFSPPLCEQIPHDNIEVTSQLLQNKLNKEILQMECEHPGKIVKKDGYTDNEQPLENQQNDMLHNIEANEKMIQSADTAVQRNEMEQFMHHQESVQNKQYLQDEGEEPMRQNEWNMPSGTDEHLKEDTGAVDISVLDVVDKQTVQKGQTEILNVVEQAVHNEEIKPVPNNKQIVGKTIFNINDYRITRTKAPPLTQVTPQVSYRKYEVDVEKIKHHVKCVAPDISKHELHMIYDVFRYDVLCHNDDEDDGNWRKKHDDKNDDGSVGELTNHSCTVSGSSVPRPLENAVLPLKKRNTTSYNLEDSADIDYHDRSTDSKLICEQQIELVTDDSSQDILSERVNILSPKHAEVFKNTFDKSSSQTKQNSTENINISFASDPANEENTTSKERNYDDTRKQFEKEQTPRGNHKKFVSGTNTYCDAMYCRLLSDVQDDKLCMKSKNDKENKCEQYCKNSHLYSHANAVHNGVKQCQCNVCKKMLICHICNKRFSQKGSLIIHMRMHSGDKPFSCNICSKTFSDSSKLRRHINIHTGERQYSCNICSKKFNQKNNLLTHMKVHSGNKPFSCNICSKIFNLKGNLTKHIRVHSGDKPFSCNICSKTFTRKNTLTEHINIHTCKKQYTCKICSKTFNWKANLITHMRIHSGDKPYSCNICSKTFRESGALTRHMRIHSGKKPFPCNICSKTFRESGNLTKHMRVHSDDKPFSCNVCSKTFYVLITLTKHMKIHTCERQYSCYICSKIFNWKHNLTTHMRVHSDDKQFS